LHPLGRASTPWLRHKERHKKLIRRSAPIFACQGEFRPTREWQKQCSPGLPGLPEPAERRNWKMCGALRAGWGRLDEAPSSTPRLDTLCLPPAPAGRERAKLIDEWVQLRVAVRQYKGGHFSEHASMATICQGWASDDVLRGRQSLRMAQPF